MKYAIILLVVIVMVGCYNNKEGMCSSTCSTCSNFVFDKDDNKCSMEQCFDCKNMKHTEYLDKIYKLLYPSIASTPATIVNTTVNKPSETKSNSTATTPTKSSPSTTVYKSTTSDSNKKDSTVSEPFHILLGLFLILLVLIGYLIKYSLNV